MCNIVVMNLCELYNNWKLHCEVIRNILAHLNLGRDFPVQSTGSSGSV